MNRRKMLKATATLATSAALLSLTPKSEGEASVPIPNTTAYPVTRDGTRLHVEDWGDGRPIVFLSAWGEYIAALSARGHRCVAIDRRGHGRSEAPNTGYEADTLADDVAAVIEQRDLRDIVLVGYSMGSIEAVRYLSRHGTSRVGKLALIAPTTPFLMKTGDNPEGVPQEMRPRPGSKRMNPLS